MTQVKVVPKGFDLTDDPQFKGSLLTLQNEFVGD